MKQLPKGDRSAATCSTGTAPVHTNRPIGMSSRTRRTRAIASRTSDSSMAADFTRSTAPSRVAEAPLEAPVCDAVQRERRLGELDGGAEEIVREEGRERDGARGVGHLRERDPEVGIAEAHRHEVVAQREAVPALFLSHTRPIAGGLGTAGVVVGEELDHEPRLRGFIRAP